MLLEIIGDRWRWITMAGRITTASLLNQAMHTSKYDFDNVQDVPLDVIHLASAMLQKD